MNKISTKIVMLIASMIVGFLIATNFNFAGFSSAEQMTTKEYGDAIEERNKLYKEISSIQEENRKMEKRLNESNKDDKSQEKVLEDMKEQLRDYGMLSGLNEVKGPGIVLTINDGEISYEEDTTDDIRSSLFHDSDMVLVLNELRKAGAEVIAINNYRLLPTSGLSCYWSSIKIDDTSEYAPFVFYAIGDPELMKASLYNEGSHINTLLLRELKVNLEIKEEIIIPAARKEIKVNYMTNENEK